MAKVSLPIQCRSLAATFKQTHTSLTFHQQTLLSCKLAVRLVSAIVNNKKAIWEKSRINLFFADFLFTYSFAFFAVFQKIKLLALCKSRLYRVVLGLQFGFQRLQPTGWNSPLGSQSGCQCVWPVQTTADSPGCNHQQHLWKSGLIFVFKVQDWSPASPFDPRFVCCPRKKGINIACKPATAFQSLSSV